MKRFVAHTLLAAVCLFAPGTGTAQDAEGEVAGVVDALFEAMREADSAKVRSLFHPELERIGSSGFRDSTPVVRFGTIESFIESVGSHQPGELDERIGEPSIRIDDALATVFTPYQLYYKGHLSHCGVNVFQIARSGDEWRIVGLIDTRRRAGCEEWLQ